MVIFGEMLHDEPTRKAGLNARRPLRVAARGYAPRVALAALLAASVLLTPALAQTDTRDANARPAQAPAPTRSAVAKPGPGSPKSPVSPYAAANRQRAEASAGAPAQSMKRAPGQPPRKGRPVRAKRA